MRVDTFSTFALKKDVRSWDEADYDAVGCLIASGFSDELASIRVMDASSKVLDLIAFINVVRVVHGSRVARDAKRKAAQYKKE
jgi:hypothetical protein